MHARSCVSGIDTANRSWPRVGTDETGDSKSVPALEHRDSEGCTFTKTAERRLRVEEYNDS